MKRPVKYSAMLSDASVHCRLSLSLEYTKGAGTAPLREAVSFRKKLFGVYGPGPFDRLWDPGFCLKPSISVCVRDRLALGACSLFGSNFCWFGSRSRFSFLWKEILLCLRSETVRLREPVLVMYGPGLFSFEGETRR